MAEKKKKNWGEKVAANIREKFEQWRLGPSYVNFDSRIEENSDKIFSTSFLLPKPGGFSKGINPSTFGANVISCCEVGKKVFTCPQEKKNLQPTNTFGQILTIALSLGSQGSQQQKGRFSLPTEEKKIRSFKRQRPHGVIVPGKRAKPSDLLTRGNSAGFTDKL
ncbi:hypothetical protein TNIN_24441 [Trichonephila inaurata madagascariensis]|uniref:Uncharacterized protein n=1 Tax=Trichonephila inaurata madagascariensis TaxID=2747483 RepID=A0A8X7CJI1_9ARAC|nr:hypothetical protein TNIN_24441 [Trichonephila inaurata madagascariensis]